MNVPGSMVSIPLSQTLMRSPEIVCQVRVRIADRALLISMMRNSAISYIQEYFLEQPFRIIYNNYNPSEDYSVMRGEMNRQGTITDLGVADYEANGEIKGSLAIKVHLDDDKIRIDLRIVNEGGGILAEWEGVDVIDDSQLTWCFSDVGDIKIIMNPIIEPDA